jgi:hypothetical protein
MDTVKKYLRNLTVGLVALAVIIAAIHFPYDVDAPLTPQEIEVVQKYYTEAYKKPSIERQQSSEYETKYLQVSEAAAKSEGIEEEVSAFVEHFNLRDRPVLDVGSGRGYLQDVAQNYTGLDISPSVARFYHKKFVAGSARQCRFQIIVLTVHGRFGYSSMCQIQSRRFMKLGGSQETKGYFTYVLRGIVSPGWPKVTKLGPILIWALSANSLKQVFRYDRRRFLCK